MKIGFPREIKDQEKRVAMTPNGVRHLVAHGHQVRVECDAGLGSGYSNREYQEAGAALTDTGEVWDSELVVKVKEPLAAEYAYLRDQMIFTFFHLAGADPLLSETLLARGTTALAYETLEDELGRLPLLAPMSAIAGNMASLVGAYFLGRPQGGRGVQLGTVGGKRYGRVLVLGGGIVGMHAARVAAGMGANVLMAGLDGELAANGGSGLGEGIRYFLSSPDTVGKEARNADLVIGAVLVRGDRTPRIVTSDMVDSMLPGAVIVDVSIDQGGSVETSRPTTHSEPVFEQFGVIHYCVTNMPGAYPRTATEALAGATLAYVTGLAGQGLDFLRQRSGLSKAVNTYRGSMTCLAAAGALDLSDHYHPFVESYSSESPVDAGRSGA
ncbi:MAG: alanine dehydrogenase [Pseudomonadota bacterium]|nr:alanine dehydrogenase [Pseudomonadota bacterium]